MMLRAERVDLGQLVLEAWEQLAPERKGRDAELIPPQDGVDPHCEVDEFAIRNTLRNLFENALAACEDPVKIDTEFFEAKIASRPALKIAVRDNGPGLPEDVKAQAFDAFFTTKTRGTGLGLAIVKRTVEEHGGRVALGSNHHNAGAEFLLTLPRTQR
jgi:signal transduction histidine kinase